MSELLSALLPAVPQAAMIYVQATLLPMRKRWLFVTLEALLSCAALLVRLTTTGIVSESVHFGISLIAMFVLPPLFYRHIVPLPWRLVATAVAVLLMFLGEMACGALWVASGHEYSQSAMQSAPLLMSVVIHLFFVAVILIGGHLFRTLFRKQRVERLASSTGGVLLCGLPVSQALLVWVLLFIMMHVSDAGDRGPILTAALILIALCIVSDALLIRSVNGYWRTLDERRYAKKLEQRMQEQLDGFTRLNAQIASTAHLRHDMRNHLLVLGVFVDQGEFEQANAYADNLLAELEKADQSEAA